MNTAHAQEGSVKFNCHFTLQKMTIPSELYIPLNHWRDELWHKSLIGADTDGIGYGNISVRVPKSDQFYISGTATGGIPELHQMHYSLVERCELEQNTIWCRGLVKASAESMSHAAIYSACSEAGAVVHIHNLQLWEKMLDVLPTTAKNVEYGTPGMAYEIGRIMTLPQTMQKKVFVMGGHEAGIISFGDTVEEAALIILALGDG